MHPVNNAIEAIQNAIDQLKQEKMQASSDQSWHGAILQLENKPIPSQTAESITILETCSQLLAQTKTIKNASPSVSVPNSGTVTLNDIIFRLATGKGDIILSEILYAMISKRKTGPSKLNYAILSRTLQLDQKTLSGFIRNEHGMSSKYFEKIVNHIQATNP